MMIKEKQNIYNLLQKCKVEKDVEEKYKRIISEYFPNGVISSPYYTDGVLKNGITMLMEFKYDLDLTKNLQVAELIIQIIYYLKQFELHGEELPAIIFGGDKNECFCLHSNDLLSYLNEDVDWSIAPSLAASKNPDMIIKISKDNNINPYIWHIDNDHFDFKFVVDHIVNLGKGTVQKVRITELNINRFFSYFRDRIIKQKKKYSPEELVAIFLNCLIDSGNNYPHPRKKNTLVTNVVGDVLINRSLYDAFFEHFETMYSIEEKKRLTAICDRLITDEARRFHGEFYTPTEWVLEAHKMIEDTFGPNWKDEYVVWDPAWGTGNLTRDFKFKELYCSTLNYGDLQVGQHYNPEAIEKFQYDFLNDDITPEGLLPIDKIKLPRGLIQALSQGKKILIFMNPPFGTEANLRKANKEDIAKTNIYKIMKVNRYGKSVQDLYSQFLYRILNIRKIFKTSDISLAIFSPCTFLTLRGFKSFREYFLNDFLYQSGFCFDAKEFGISGNWPLLFTTWSVGNTRQDSFECIIKEKKIDDCSYEIIDIGKKAFYNVDRYKSGIEWSKEKIQPLQRVEMPKVSSPFKFTQNGTNTSENALGFFACGANNLEQGKFCCEILTCGYSNYYGHPFDINAFFDICSFYTARKSVLMSWFNRKDEYIKPNISHTDYNQWNVDSMIYSLFSNQFSARQITYKDKLWDIKNEWFWMSNEQMLQLANEHGFDELYHDANGDHDRFVFNKIQESSFSEDAADVLNKAIELVIKTFPYRQPLHEEHPEWHLHAWDAGWYQIKLVLKQYFKDDLKEFNLLYKAFEDRMREGVYKFGFLK